MVDMILLIPIMYERCDGFPGVDCRLESKHCGV